MCLETRQICPLKAKKDIVCYKLFLSHDSLDSMKTLYMDYYVKKPTEGCPTVMDDTNVPLRISQYGYLHPLHRISSGMIHAYQTEIRALANRFHTFKRHTYKCIIPKGTLYYIGIDGDICAKKMLVIEEVNPNTAG